MTTVEMTKIHLCDSCVSNYPECNATIENINFGDGIGKDNVCACSVYMTQHGAVEKFKLIKEKQAALSKEADEIINRLPDLVMYQNDDSTWTRFSKIDNLKELEEKGSFFRASSINRYTTKVETLKNKPKELTL